MVLYEVMFPVISLGPFSISSFGIFLAIGFLFGVFLVWRLSRAWDQNEERILDLTLLTFLGGLIGSRVYFVLENFQSFGFSPLRYLLFSKYPGFSFFGAFLGGFLAVYFFAKKFKINFWMALDFASVGLLGGLIFESLGCFLGGCNIGVESNLFFAQPFVGALGKRFPVQIFEAMLFSFALIRIWKRATHFHTQGTIFAISLIYIGAIKLIMDSFRENSEGIFLNVILISLGTTIFYKITKREILSDIKASYFFLVSIIKDPQVRRAVVVSLRKSWYNYSVSFRWKLRLLAKILRRINVYFSHKDSKYY